MAVKRTVTRKANELRALKTVRSLTRRAQAELTQLLRSQRTGTITRRKLDTGLRELRRRLNHIAMHEFRL